MPLLTVVLVPAPERVVLRLTGEADLSTLSTLSDALAEAADTGAEHVVVDVRAVHFWDSSNLGALAIATAALTASGRTCRVVGAGTATRRLIHLAAYDGLLDVDGPSAGDDAVHGHRGTVSVDGVRRAA